MNKSALNLISSATLVITFILFALAAYIHGLSSELLLEAGVFLVSVKLVLSMQKTENQISELEKKIDALHAKLDAKSR